jgi:acyl carrier protein
MFAESPSGALEEKEIADRVIKVLKTIPELANANITPTTSFKNDLNFDSLKTVELSFPIESEFGVQFEDQDVTQWATVEDIIRTVKVLHPSQSFLVINLLFRTTKRQSKVKMQHNVQSVIHQK